MSDRLKLGIVGINWRGSDIKPAIDATGLIDVTAICATRPDRLAEAAKTLGVEATYTDYDRFLDEADVDAVFLATPMELHVAQSVAAMERGIHVLCEVPAATDVEECRVLVDACQRSDAVFMIAEQYNYRREPAAIAAMAERGAFGDMYYAEGEFNQNIQSILDKTPWRRRWQVGVNGITYGPHSLGPVLMWMAGDRVTSVCCAGAGRRYRDGRGELLELEPAATMLCRTARGALVRVRCDLLSERPMGVHYQLQGTDGFYDRGDLWLRSRSADSEQSESLDAVAESFLPGEYLEAEAKCRTSGCACDDYLMLHDFVESVRRGEAVTLDIHQAMDMTLPGLVSQQSIAQHSAWVNVPDSREF
ncbi:MAG: hypothetical protein CMJ18_24440 [Phycisphaeraceae bacterium]|nr:hypothetical protein [Phycisphaeraceae bacterium]